MEHDYYDNAENVENYSKFTPAHDGALLVDTLSAHLPEGSTVLELGIGPGAGWLDQVYCHGHRRVGVALGGAVVGADHVFGADAKNQTAGREASGVPGMGCR